jgi:hypothetical protein
VKVVEGSEIYNFPIHYFVHIYSTFWSFTCSDRDTVTQLGQPTSRSASVRSLPRRSRPKTPRSPPPSHRAPGRAPRRTGQGERRAEPSVCRLPPRTRCPEAPYHGAVHRLALLHEVALLFKTVALLPARTHHAPARAIRRRHWRPPRRAQGRPAALPHWASPTSPGTY